MTENKLNRGRTRNKFAILSDKLWEPRSDILIGRKSVRHYQYNECGGRAFDYALREYHLSAFNSEGTECYFRGEFYLGPVGKCRFCFTEVNLEKRYENQRDILRSVASAAIEIANSLIREKIGSYNIINGKMENNHVEKVNAEKLSKTEERLFRTVLKRALRGYKIYERQNLHHKFVKALQC